MTNLETYMEEIEVMIADVDVDCELYHLSTGTSEGCPDNKICKECRRKSLHWLLEDAEE